MSVRTTTQRIVAVLIVGCALMAGPVSAASARPIEGRGAEGCGWGTTSYPEGAIIATANNIVMQCRDGEWNAIFVGR
jgi:hypothetical protein